MTYTAPIKDLLFTLKDVLGFERLESLEGFEDFNMELAEAVLTEAGRIAKEEIAQTNVIGDQVGAKLENGVVRIPEEIKASYNTLVEGGWLSLPYDPEYGGQGLPITLDAAVMEIWDAANLALGLAPMLSGGAIKAIQAHATDEIKATYLPNLISGKWNGTMNLTESHAGSDVGALRTKAEPTGDGTYLIRGNKIFITYGDHDMTDNIIHLVLARLPGAPDGTRGITLFLVPKFMVGEDGSLGKRNDVKVLKIEEKLGIHASPTCVLEFGEDEGAIGYLIGEENKGMAAMFTMMNMERLYVGIQGVGVGERAYQQSVAYATERLQGKPFGKQHAQKEMVPIIEHADVRRMLMTQRAYVEATRMLCMSNALAADLAKHASTEEERAKAKGREELLTPISKAWATDVSGFVANLAVQIHGGMGFIEETGVAQYVRDARITEIYEGTNGIQAMDLVTRKLNMGGGSLILDFFQEIRDNIAKLDETLPDLSAGLNEAVMAADDATHWLLKSQKENPLDVLGGATPYLRLMGSLTGGYYLALGALAASKALEANAGDKSFYEAKIVTANFYVANILKPALGLVSSIKSGASDLYAMEPEAFLR
jgi:3-(methylsulfanyl)propanoyl-CoA dehydrogenase